MRNQRHASDLGESGLLSPLPPPPAATPVSAKPFYMPQTVWNMFNSMRTATVAVQGAAETGNVQSDIDGVDEGLLPPDEDSSRQFFTPNSASRAASPTDERQDDGIATLLVDAPLEDKKNFADIPRVMTLEDLHRASINGGPAASAAVLNGTQSHLASALAIAQKIVWGGSIPYALLITVIYAMFAEQRAEGNPWYSALLVTASVLFNVFGALLFPKRTANLVKDFSRRHDDLGYRGFFTVGTIFACMTILGSIAISQSSVKIWPFGWMLLATACFGLNTGLTRLVGSVGAMDRGLKAYKLSNVFALLAEFDLKQDLIEANTQGVMEDLGMSDEALLNWIVEEMGKVSTPTLRLAADKGQSLARVVLAAASTALIPMWMSMTQTGLDKIHDGLGDLTALVTVAGFSNALFYGLSCYDVIPAMKDLHHLLSEKTAKGLASHVANATTEAVIRHAIVITELVAFLTLAYFSGGGFGASVKTMQSHGFGSVADETTPQFLFDIMENIYISFAQTMAGLVNANSTARFILDVSNENKLHSEENVGRTLLYFMRIKDRPVALKASDTRDSLNDSLLNREGSSVLVLRTRFEAAKELLSLIRVAAQKNNYKQEPVVDKHGALVPGKTKSVKDMLALPAKEAKGRASREISVPMIAKALKKHGTFSGDATTEETSLLGRAAAKYAAPMAI